MNKNNNYLYGFNTIKNLIKYKSEYIKKIFLLKKNNKKFIKITKILNIKKISYKIVNKKFFKKFNLFNHQGIISYIKRKKIFSSSVNKLISFIKKKKKHFFLILDRITDPYNLGSCIRTAVAANIDAIIISKHNSVSIENNIVHKVSVGSIYKIFIITINNIKNIIKLLHKYNFLILGTDLNSKKSIYGVNYNMYNSIALIFGSENKGIKKKIKEKCDFLLRIPIKKINSLNVSVSIGIIIFEIMRQIKNL